MERDQNVSLEEIVFSCNVCQATVSDIYTPNENFQGGRAEGDIRDGLVTKLWISECSHVTCAQHLDGGAAPFHPKNQQPQASCPVCVAEHGDHAMKKLYSIRDLRRGEFDEHIPEVWMRCPPVRIEDHTPEMEAMRFQYSNIVRYARGVTKRLRVIHNQRKLLETSYLEEREHRSKLQDKVLDLQSRVAELKKQEVKLQKWEQRKPSINHYLRAVTEMSHDIQLMRRTLVAHGYEIPERKYAFDPNQKLHTSSQNAVTGHKYVQQLSFVTENPLSKGMSAVLQHGLWPTTSQVQLQDLSSSSSRKRKRQGASNSSLRAYSHDFPYYNEQRQSSRDLMPPPMGKVGPKESAYHLSSDTAHSREGTSFRPYLKHRNKLHRASSSTRNETCASQRQDFREIPSDLSFQSFQYEASLSHHSQRDNGTARTSFGHQQAKVMTKDDSVKSSQQKADVHSYSRGSLGRLQLSKFSGARHQILNESPKYPLTSSNFKRYISEAVRPTVFPESRHSRFNTEANDWLDPSAHAYPPAVNVQSDPKECRKLSDDQEASLPSQRLRAAVASPFFTRISHPDTSYILRPANADHESPVRPSLGHDICIGSQESPGQFIYREVNNQYLTDLPSMQAHLLPRPKEVKSKPPVRRAEFDQVNSQKSSRQEVEHTRSLRVSADRSSMARTGRFTLPVSIGVRPTVPNNLNDQEPSTLRRSKGDLPQGANNRLPQTPLRGGLFRSTFSSAGRRSVQR